MASLAIADAVVAYLANSTSSVESISRLVASRLVAKDEAEIIAILTEAQEEWNSVHCDEEGPTQAQDKELDEAIARAVARLQ